MISTQHNRRCHTRW